MREPCLRCRNGLTGKYTLYFHSSEYHCAIAQYRLPKANIDLQRRISKSPSGIYIDACSRRERAELVFYFFGGREW